MGERVAIVVKGYPRLSETFIAQELLSLQERGVDFAIYSLRNPYDAKTHPVHAAITAPVRYLPEYLYRGPLRVFRAWRKLRQRPGYKAALRAWLKDWRRDLTPNRGRRFGQALVLAAEMPDSVEWIYVHYLHTPASVVRYAAMIRGLPWSCSAHAKDIYTTPDWEKAEKLADLSWLVTCTRANAEHLRGLANGAADKVHLLYHGLDFARFPDHGRAARDRDGSDPANPVIILSVGRLVPKKGYGVLLHALALLPRDLAWRFVHIGGGGFRRLPIGPTARDKLKGQARRLGIEDRIDWRGAQAQGAVLEAYRQADIFALACRIADDGDRDGLPNVLMEAQSQGLACLSTRVSATSELIVDGETGLLVDPDDPAALASALERLIRDPDLRRRLGEAGAGRVRARFSHAQAIDLLAERLLPRVGVPAA